MWSTRVAKLVRKLLVETECTCSTGHGLLKDGGIEETCGKLCLVTMDNVELRSGGKKLPQMMSVNTLKLEAACAGSTASW